MPSRRYTIVIADRHTGVLRRLSISFGPTLLLAAFAISLPILIGLGAALKARAEVTDLYATRGTLELENANYRAATETLADQIQTLQSTMSDLGVQAALDPSLRSAMDKLPSVVKSRAMGGPRSGAALATIAPGLNSPEDTLGLVRELLESLESRLRLVRSDVDKRNALAAATPSIWPAHGWLTSRMGTRVDPLDGGPDTHQGLDISADRGTSVYATADGEVKTAAYQGAYGNLIVVDHGFGLETRYGHLSAFDAKVGQHVQRGDPVGRVGSTGRATGSHLHYEIRVNGRVMNPLQLLLNPRRNVD